MFMSVILRGSRRNKVLGSEMGTLVLALPPNDCYFLAQIGD